MPIYRIRHRTHYVYESEVDSSMNQARLRPRDLTGQRLLQFNLTGTPALEGLSEWKDYFGNPTLFFQVPNHHSEFELVAESRVDVSFAMPTDPPPTPPWEEAVAALKRGGQETFEALPYTLESPLVRVFPDLAKYARRSFPPGRSLGEAALGLMFRLNRDFKFLPGSTSLKTTLEMVFQTRCGVCQDFSHLMIGCFRAMGLAARYVSGYLETDPPPGKPKLVGADASHAWVSLFLPGGGWLDLDPTNGIMPGERHVTVAWGRDFSDVSPLRGVIFGGGSQEMKVEVDVDKEPDPKPKGGVEPVAKS